MEVVQKLNKRMPVSAMLDPKIVQLLQNAGKVS
jgi:hypothetical protein